MNIETTHWRRCYFVLAMQGWIIIIGSHIAYFEFCSRLIGLHRDWAIRIWIVYCGSKLIVGLLAQLAVTSLWLVEFPRNHTIHWWRLAIPRDNPLHMGQKQIILIGSLLVCEFVAYTCCYRVMHFSGDLVRTVTLVAFLVAVFGSGEDALF